MAYLAKSQMTELDVAANGRTLPRQRLDPDDRGLCVMLFSLLHLSFLRDDDLDDLPRDRQREVDHLLERLAGRACGAVVCALVAAAWRLLS